MFHQFLYLASPQFFRLMAISRTRQEAPNRLRTNLLVELITNFFEKQFHVWISVEKCTLLFLNVTALFADHWLGAKGMKSPFTPMPPWFSLGGLSLNRELKPP